MKQAYRKWRPIRGLRTSSHDLGRLEEAVKDIMEDELTILGLAHRARACLLKMRENLPVESIIYWQDEARKCLTLIEEHVKASLPGPSRDGRDGSRDGAMPEETTGYAENAQGVPTSWVGLETGRIGKSEGVLG